MGLGDLGSVVFILFIFVLLHLMLSINIGISNVKNNWSNYKCNPGIMPFAFIFGHNTKNTFDECVKLKQNDFMKVFLQPVYGGLGYFAKSGAEFTEIFDQLKLFGNRQDDSMKDLDLSITDRFQNFTFEMEEVFIRISDSFGKIFSTTQLLFLTSTSTIEAAKISWNELPGTFIKLGTGQFDKIG